MANKQEFCKECNYLGYLVKDDCPPFSLATLCPSCKHLCHYCQGEKFIKKINEKGIDFFILCKCQELANKIILYNKAQIPNRFSLSLKAKNFSNNFLKEPYKKAIKFVKNFQPLSKGLIFSGPIGCGKTTIVSAIIQQITLDKGHSCLFFEFSRLLEEIRNCYNKKQTEADLLDKICQTSLLVIDELGKGKDSEWELGIIESLVNRRYNTKQTTLFTTNFALKKNQNTPALITRISERTYSRIQEMCDFITIKGVDLRKKALADIYQNTTNLVVQKTPNSPTQTPLNIDNSEMEV